MAACFYLPTYYYYVLTTPSGSAPLRTQGATASPSASCARRPPARSYVASRARVARQPEHTCQLAEVGRGWRPP